MVMNAVRTFITMHRAQLLPITLITILAAYLRLYDLDRIGLGNLYYASTVYSMGLSLSNFIFASYDPLGTFMVDKPPVGLWVQVFFSKIIGFNGLAMILPMAIASTLAVPLIYLASKNSFDNKTSLTAALMLAVFPGSIAIARDSTMDSMLMLVQVISILVLQLAVTRRSFQLLIVWSLIMGIAFNVKFLQAFIVLPASFTYFVICWDESFIRRLIKWSTAIIVLILVSASWAWMIHIVPADDRPRVINDPSESIIGLIFNYNGINRTLPQEVIVFQSSGANAVAHLWGVNNMGPGRILGSPNGLLLGTMTILAIVGICSLWFLNRNALRGPPIIWFVWCITGLVIFTFGNRSPVHYFESFSPAVAVLASYGLWGLMKYQPVDQFISYSGQRYRGVLESTSDSIEWWGTMAQSMLRKLPLILVIVFCIISSTQFPPFSRYVFIACGITFLGTLSLMAVSYWSLPIKTHKIASVITMSGLMLMIVIPSIWITHAAPRGDSVVTMPNPLEYARVDGMRPQGPWVPGQYAMEYALENVDTEYVLAVDGFQRAAELISKFQQPVLPFWNQWIRKPVYDVEGMTEIVANGKARFFLVNRRTFNTLPTEYRNLLYKNCTNAAITEFFLNDNPVLLNALVGDSVLWDCESLGLQ